MKIDVSDLIKLKSVRKDLDLDLDLGGFDYGYDFIKVIEPIKFKGQLDVYGELFELQGIVTGTIELTCARCLVQFPHVLNIEVNEKFSNDADIADKDDEVTLIESTTLDITEIVLGNIILSLPIKRLCRETCRGLCPHCGTDLNVSPCNCEVFDVDPRLARLKNFFD
ncbi:MAG: DUF177 domain-containing protein [Clostridiaceae bacterium]